MRRFHETRCIDLSQTTLQATIGENIKATIQLLGNSLMRNFLKLHLVESFIFSQSLAACCLLSIVTCLVPLLLVLFSAILVLESIFVLNLHIDRIVHHSLVLDGDWELFDLILAMNFCLSLELLLELSFLISVNI